MKAGLKALTEAARWVDAALDKRSMHDVVSIRQTGGTIVLEAAGIDEIRSATVAVDPGTFGTAGLPSGALVARLAMLRGTTVTVDRADDTLLRFTAGRSTFTLATLEADAGHRAAAVRDQAHILFRADAGRLRQAVGRAARFAHPKLAGRWESTIGMTVDGDSLTLQAGGSASIGRIGLDVDGVTDGFHALPPSVAEALAAMSGTVDVLAEAGRVVFADAARIAILPTFDLPHPRTDFLFQHRDQHTWAVRSAELAAVLPLLVTDDPTVTVTAGPDTWTMTGSDAQAEVDAEAAGPLTEPVVFKIDGRLLADALDLGPDVTISEPKPVLVSGDHGTAAIAPIRTE